MTSSAGSSVLHRGVLPRPAVAVMAAWAVVMASALGWMLPVTPSASAQVPPSVSGFPAAVWAPVSVPDDLAPELQMTSLYVPPVAAGQRPSVAVGFAGPFELPAGRWRVSVGVGDPTGVVVRTSMLWDGNQSVGVVERLEGFLVEDLGSVEVSVQASGLVVIGLPDEVFGGLLGDVLWVEAVLGADSAADATVRSDWYSRSAVFGEGAPGLVTGGSIGSTVGPKKDALGTGAEAVVVDTGAPATVQVTGDLAVVELAAPPAVIAGTTVAEVVDVVTFSADPVVGTTGPQVRVNRTSGTVDLTLGTLGGPVSLNDSGAPVVAADPTWLPSADPGPNDPSSPAVATLIVDLAGAFGQLGLGLPGDSLAVTITRVVTATDSTQVLTAGMAADRSWLDLGAPVVPVTSVVVQEIDTDDDSGLLVLIVAGVLVGLAAVAGSIALLSARSRRKGTNRSSVQDTTGGSAFDWTYGSATDTETSQSTPVNGSADEHPETAPNDVFDHDATAGEHDPGPAPVVPPGTDPAPVTLADTESTPLAALDEALEALERRLRRLDSNDE